MEKYHSHKISYQLKCVIITCRIFYRAKYNDIERKTVIAQNIAQKIAKETIDQIDCEDIYKIIARVIHLNS